MNSPTAQTSPVKRNRPIFLVLITAFGLLLVAWGLFGVISRAIAIKPPVVRMAGLEDEVVQALKKGYDAVHRRPLSAESWGYLGMVLHAHEFGEAKACYLEAAKRNSSDPRWPYLTARILLGNDPEAAIPFLRKATELAGDAEMPRLTLAEQLLERGQ